MALCISINGPIVASDYKGPHSPNLGCGYKPQSIQGFRPQPNIVKRQLFFLMCLTKTVRIIKKAVYAERRLKYLKKITQTI